MTDKSDEKQSGRPLIGDWIGSLYGMGGDRWDWELSLFRNGSYERRTAAVRRPDKGVSEKGAWFCEEGNSLLVLRPTEGKSSRWNIHDVTGLERANTLLVLREAILASRNLPILFYRVHLHPTGPPTPYDAHGFLE